MGAFMKRNSKERELSALESVKSSSIAEVDAKLHLLKQSNPQV